MKTYIATLHCRASGRFMLRVRVTAGSLRDAEEAALATAGLTLRLGPPELTVRRLCQI